MEEEEIIYRMPIAEIRRQAGVRTPGYEAAMLAAGRADPNGVYWIIGYKARREIWRAHGAPGLDLEHGGGCEGCGD